MTCICTALTCLRTQSLRHTHIARVLECKIFRHCHDYQRLATWPVQVPFLFKYAVDALTADPSGATAATTPLLALMPATVLLGYGAARAGSALFNELRKAVFARVRLVSPVVRP